MRFFTVLLALLALGCTVENPSTSNDSTTTKDGKKAVDDEENIEEKYDNRSVLDMDKKMTTLLDGTRVLNLTCTVAKKHQAVITNVLSVGWKRKPPTGDNDFDLIMELDQGEFIWGEEIQKSWKKFLDVKEHGRAYGQDGAVAFAFVTIHIPVLPRENNGMFQCFMVTETYTGEQKEWSRFYKDKNNLLVDILSNIGGLQLKLGITLLVLIGILFSVAVIINYLDNKKKNPVTEGSEDKKEETGAQPDTDMQSPSSKHKSEMGSSSSMQEKRSGSHHHSRTSRKSSHSREDNVYSNEIDEETLYFKAHCLASMKKQRYQVYVCMTSKDGTCTVDFAYCQCPIGLAQSCSHIGGLLFAISNRQSHNQHGNESGESCTSRLCAWKVPRSMNQTAKPLRNMDLSKPKIDKVTPSSDRINTSTDFDPRHSNDRGNDTAWTISQLVKLKAIFPQTGMAHLWQIPDEAPPAYVEEEVQTTVHPLQLLMESMVYSENTFPPPVIDQVLVEYIEQQTRGQRNCPMWKDLHKGRITSSLFGSVLKAGSNPSSLVKQILEGSNLDRYAKLPEAVQWGVYKEESARADYLMIRNAVDECTVQPTGLTLYPTHSFLGASSDGRVFEQDSSGLLEIKCPFSINGKLVNNMEVADILSMDEASFCMEMSETGPKLKKLHKHYAQVQGEMAIMGQPWCDFVIWTNAKSNNICIDRVLFDPEFVTSMMPKLVKFYMEHIFHRIYHA